MLAEKELMDEVLSLVADTLKNFVEMSKFNTMYKLYDPSTGMFFFRNKHIMIEVDCRRVNAIDNVIEEERETGEMDEVLSSVADTLKNFAEMLEFNTIPSTSKRC
nr:thioredoxin-like protein YLS8 [Tanacetum cinerariifolium]